MSIPKDNFTSTQKDILQMLVQHLFRLKASVHWGNGGEKNSDVVAGHEDTDH